MTILARATRGLAFLWDGLRLLRQVPGLWLWALIPFLLDIVLLLVLMSWAIAQLKSWVGLLVHWILGASGGWLHTLLYYPVLVVLAVGLFVMLVYAIAVLGSLIASPFNAVIAEKILVHQGALAPAPFRWGSWFRTTLRMIATSLARATLLLILGVVFLILSLLPGLNLVASFGALLILASDSADYALESLGLSLSARFRFIRSHLPEFCGMAGALGLTLLIPGLTLLLLPASVAGAASVVARLKKG